MVLISEALKADYCFFWLWASNYSYIIAQLISISLIQVLAQKQHSRSHRQWGAEGPDFFIQGVTEKEHKLLLKT